MDIIVPDGSIGLGTSADQLATEIGLTADEVAWRTDFVDFTTEDETRLASMSDVVEDNMEALVARHSWLKTVRCDSRLDVRFSRPSVVTLLSLGAGRRASS
ncbi:hypothetical protein SAMN04487949_3734 [Halogranum gelatinilyticum]|uniref:Globin-sensor domain-containing protein n=1 Tax=Halogranum gelatinilyticum TaxID=660521 RepID=A0A1G9ZRZ9_9EURY|nr:hypothetical protein [Halogranum gelatinilyticum]SDN23980.1 hypothetical protein SAMN04487949_3734 [Halogranum gelatinilyticum]